MMNDRDEIIACYRAMYEGEIRKDTEYLKTVLDPSWYLIHMTGVRMNRQEFFEALIDNTLNYYRCRHIHTDTVIEENTARMAGDTRVEAAVYGSGKHWWNLRLDSTFEKKEGKWFLTGCTASVF